MHLACDGSKSAEPIIPERHMLNEDENEVEAWAKGRVSTLLSQACVATYLEAGYVESTLSTEKKCNDGGSGKGGRGTPKLYQI